MGKTVMEEFSITEISAVDLPAQAGAKAKVIKRKGATAMAENFAKALEEANFSEVIAKRYIDPAEGVVSFGEVLSEELKCRNYYEIMEKVYPYICAMETSVRSIAGDVSLDSQTRLSMMRNTIEDFMSTLRNMWSGADEFMMSALDKFSGEGEDDMATKAKTVEELTKANEALAAQVAELTKSLEAANETKGAKKSGDKNADAIASLEKQLGELTEKLAASEEARKDAEAVSKLSASEKEYMRSLKTEKERKEFMQMSPADRKGRMKKSEDGDEVIKVEGVGEIRKSQVGDTQFAVFKAQQDRLDKAEKSAAEEREERQTVVFKSRVEKELAHLPGKDDEKVSVLKAIQGLDSDVQVAIEKMFDAGEKAIAQGFQKFGHRDTGDHGQYGKQATGDSVAKSKWTAIVSDIQKRDGISRTKALSKARQENPEAYEAYQAD